MGPMGSRVIASPLLVLTLEARTDAAIHTEGGHQYWYGCFWEEKSFLFVLIIEP